MEIELKSLIVGADTAARMRLKEALQRVLSKSIVFQARTKNEALEIATREKDLSAVFLHSTLTTELIDEIRKEVKESKVRYQPIFVLKLHVDDNHSDFISRHLIKGVEGFLKEPFSTDDVNECIEIAFENRTKEIALEEKMLSALRFMVREGTQLLDDAALERNKSDGKGGGFALKKMKRLKMRIRGIGKDLFQEQIEPMILEEVEEQAKKLDLTAFKKRELKIVFAEHPGIILSRILDERKLTSKRLSELLSNEEAEIDLLLGGEKRVSLALSKKLARILGNTEDHWLSLQKAFDEYERSKQLL